MNKGSRFRSFGNLALGLSLLTFAIYFLNVVVGGPLGMKPWMSDVSEMLTLFVAVILFVAGVLAREEEAEELDSEKELAAGTLQDLGH